MPPLSTAFPFIRIQRTGGKKRKKLICYMPFEFFDIKVLLYGLYKNIDNIDIDFKYLRKSTDDFSKYNEKLLELFEKKRILCAMRRGPYGVEAVNHKIEDELRRKGLIRVNSRWYHGCPIMITRNDYQLQLFNGDVGIILKGDNYKLQAFFPSPDGKIRAFWPNRLPEHETVYAMTIHKSQGSEFEHVLILLPDQFSPVLSRELIYTGITRAKKYVSIWGTEQVFKAAVLQKIARSSGLREQLSVKF